MGVRRGVAALCALVVLICGGAAVAEGRHDRTHGPAGSSACANPSRRAFPVRVLAPARVQGAVLPGRRLRSQVVRHEAYDFSDPNPIAPHYPGGRLPAGPRGWRGLSAIPPGHRLFAGQADATFNVPGSRYRIAFNLSHDGGMPDDAGDLTGRGVDDLVIPDHFAYVDGKQYAGEVDVYEGRRRGRIDPRHDAPDLIIYGDEEGAKLGISVAPAGDVNGDGHHDLLIAAAFATVPARRHHGTISNAGRVYLLYGGRYLRRYGCPIKIRVQDIGRTVPGISFDGGHDGSRYLAWANGLDSGDFTGDGLSDIVIGAYDPYPPGEGPTFAPRAYVIYGSRHLPRYAQGYRLGVDHDRHGIRSTTFTYPDSAATQVSLGFGAFFAGDIRGDGRSALAFSVGHGGPTGRGADYIFYGRSRPLGPVVPITSADTEVYADSLEEPALRFGGLESVRPAGDINGDGVGDLLLTARDTTRSIGGAWTAVGAVGVLYGRRGGLPRVIPFSHLDSILYGSQPGQIGHPATDRGADLNGDGHADIVVNDPYYLEPLGGALQERGRLWVISGAALPARFDVEAQATCTILADTSIPGMLGFTWNTGDFDADGRPDLVVGDHYAGDPALDVHAGRVYLFYNGAVRRCMDGGP